MAVKPLEWERKWFRLTAQTFYGRYSVGKETWTGVGFEMRDPDCGDSDTLATGEYETEQAALDAAQATHEARIRSALTHPAPAAREGWKLVPVEPIESMIEAGTRKSTGAGTTKTRTGLGIHRRSQKASALIAAKTFVMRGPRCSQPPRRRSDEH